MRVFAFETDIGKIKAPFLHADERELLLVRNHILQFVFHALFYIAFFLLFIAALVAVSFFIPIPQNIFLIIGLVSFFFVGYAIFSLYADVRFDFIFFTIDKLVIVRSSLLHQSINPVNLDFVTAVSAETQFWNMFPFGVLRIKVKNIAKTVPTENKVNSGSESDNEETDLRFPYIPNAPVFAAQINQIITDFQRRKLNIGAPLLQESSSVQQNLAAQKSILDRRAENVAKVVVPPPVKQAASGAVPKKDEAKEEEEWKKRRKKAKEEDEQRRRILQTLPTEKGS